MCSPPDNEAEAPGTVPAGVGLPVRPTAPAAPPPPAPPRCEPRDEAPRNGVPESGPPDFPGNRAAAGESRFEQPPRDGVPESGQPVPLPGLQAVFGGVKWIGRIPMKTVLPIATNFLWMYLGGLASAVNIFFYGVFLCLTVIGIPFGIQMFKLARLCLSPFGKEVGRKKSAGCLSVGFNIIWLLLGGWINTLILLLAGGLLCLTIIGIPFAGQYFKMAKLLLTPFGLEIRHSYGSFTATLFSMIAALFFDIATLMLLFSGGCGGREAGRHDFQQYEYSNCDN